MNKYEIGVLLFIIVIIIACIVSGFYLAQAIAESNLPDWLKLYLLTH